MNKDILDIHPDKIIPEPNSGCWLWTACVNMHGYGKVSLKGKLVKAHRASYIISSGEIPKGLVIMHKCDTPACVNPAHLIAGSQNDNLADMRRKNRAFVFKNFGENNGRALLNKKQVDEIRALSDNGIASKEIAKIYGVNYYVVYRIVSNQTWKLGE